MMQKGEASRLERYGLPELCQHLIIRTSADNEVILISAIPCITADF